MLQSNLLHRPPYGDLQNAFDIIKERHMFK
jgi:hypothetical protein